MLNVRPKLGWIAFISCAFTVGAVATYLTGTWWLGPILGVLMGATWPAERIQKHGKHD